MPRLGLQDALIEFYRRLATELPGDVEQALRAAVAAELLNSSDISALKTILASIEISRAESRPLCQDTGMPMFRVRLPRAFSPTEFSTVLRTATRIATAKVPLRPNAVDPITGHNTGDGVGQGIPAVYFEESGDDRIVVGGMLKGGGCENVTAIYKLPDEKLEAGRDLEGVCRCVLDAVARAQGRACPPYVVGVGMGGALDTTAHLAKWQLMRKLTDVSPVSELAGMEGRLTGQANRLGIGPSGFGGATTVLAVKAASQHRHPASFFVVVSFACWACRRGMMSWQRDEVLYDI